jgi:4-diphosphocytidyl-2-C-methyl-D-erythritol kinase
MPASAATLTLPAPAKLNLFLHITGRRDDGYHELQTVFQLLDASDELTLTARQDSNITLRCTGPRALSDVAEADNLVVRAARLLQTSSPAAASCGADIILDKHLPAGGGLGGGSSDAASALLGLTALWQLDLDAEALAALGAQLGADVPVFVRGHSAWAEGVGEKLEPIELPRRWFLVIHPSCHVSTQVIFSHPELTRDTPAITMAAFFAGQTRNDCENLVRRLAKDVDKALIWLQKFGESRMTGTGASVFASFESEAEAQAVLAQVPDEWHAFVARGVNRSPALERLEHAR